MSRRGSFQYLIRPRSEPGTLAMSDTDLDILLMGLEVGFTHLSRSSMSQGLAQSGAKADGPGILYILSGAGRILIGKHQALPVTPHTLIVTPRDRLEKLEVFVEGQDIVAIVGGFAANYGGSIDLFARLPKPLAAHFQESDRIGALLEEALGETTARQVGWSSVTASLLKQVLVATLRRALQSSNLWIESFPLLTDQRIVRAFAEMVAKPGAPHSVETLATSCGLSRSAFTARFTHALGDSPMNVLRQIRMRQAKTLLASRGLSVDQVAGVVGYSSRSSFFRALRKSGAEIPTS
jgi:AraC family transcriptional regulator, activator of mtrCDE